MKKRILTLMGLALVLALCLLAGCTGNGQTETDTDTATETATIPATETDTETTTETDTGNGAETATATETATETATMDYFESTKIELVEPDTSLVPDMSIAGDGYDIYLLTEGKEWGYRYGCTYLYNPDGSIDAYFACVGTISGEWDWISYRHSPDGGTTWENEKVVLTPTQNSMDHFSNCDPGVVYFNGYYYLGYTSTLNSTGFCNNVFVARSRTPDGPFEKWNGNGWGGPECQPIVYYDESWQEWGIGEPSFIELNGKLYMYYTSGGSTMVATADATNENWPATLQFHGRACVKGSNDSLDIKYVEEWGKFVGVCTASRMSTASYLAVYTSDDGLNFTLADCVKEGTYQFLHNAGLSSRPNGHIRLSEDADKLRVIYAYGDGWGVWNTRIQPVTLALSTGNDLAAERAKANIPDPRLRAQLIPKRQRHTAMIRTEQDIYEYELSKGEFRPLVYAYDTYFERDRYRKELTYSEYDTSVVRFENGKAIIVGVGETAVTVTSEDGLKSVFWIRIRETAGGDGSVATGFVPVRDGYTIYFGERAVYHPQIRGQIRWDNGTFTELYVDKQENFKLTFEGYDTDVISVDAYGVIAARKVGETDVVVTWNDMAFVTHVVVTDDPSAGYYTHVKVDPGETIDYTKLDFTQKRTQEAITGTNSAEVSVTDQGACLSVTGNDPFIQLSYFQSDTVLETDVYSAIEITYMVPANVSAAAQQMQVFIMCRDGSTLSEANSLKRWIRADGEFHTIRLELRGQAYWHDNIYAIRFDFFDQCSVGDVMYLQSINLVK